MIERCLMVLCFDEPLPESFNLQTPRSEKKERSLGFKAGNRDETNMMHQMLHGGGSLYNSANRWFDKTVQVKSVRLYLKLFGRSDSKRNFLFFFFGDGHQQGRSVRAVLRTLPGRRYTRHSAGRTTFISVREQKQRIGNGTRARTGRHDGQQIGLGHNGGDSKKYSRSSQRNRLVSFFFFFPPVPQRKSFNGLYSCRQLGRRLGFLRVQIHQLRERIHQILQLQPGRLFTNVVAAGLL